MNTPLVSRRCGLTVLLMLALASFSPAEDWEQLQKFVAADRAEGARFGVSVCVDGDYAIVGAYLESMDASGGNMLYAAGAAYIFVRDGGTWVQQQKLVASKRHAEAGFGYSVSISGSYAIVGALYEPYNALEGLSVFRAGAAYIFERSGTTWTQVNKVVAPDRAEDDDFGLSVGISGNYAIVGAYKQGMNANGADYVGGAGAAYIYVRTDTGWSRQQKITASVREGWAGFGYAVAISGNHAIVGAMDEDPGGLAEAGAAYVFRRDDTVWVQEEKLVAFDAEQSNEFGWSVALSGDDAAIGAYRAHYDGPGSRVNLAGAVYVYVRSDTDWILQQQIFPDFRTNAAGFGNGVSLSGDNLIGGCVTWRAHVFARSGGTWAEVRQLVAHDSLVTDGFGNSVSISGQIAMVGAQHGWLDPTGENTLSQAGAVYVFGPGSTGVRDNGPGDMSRSIQLNQNFPNPFNPATTITFELARSSDVRLTLFDLLGREMSVLVNGRMDAGSHEVRFEGTGLSAGVYFYRLQSGTISQTRKLLLVK